MRLAYLRRAGGARWDADRYAHLQITARAAPRAARLALQDVATPCGAASVIEAPTRSTSSGTSPALVRFGPRAKRKKDDADMTPM
jgi:hypothetical protein